MSSREDKIAVIIVAGGSGSRMGTALPKQFIDLGGTPVLFRTLQAFYKVLPHAQIIVVLPQAYIAATKDACALFVPGLNAVFTEGGATRYDSVQQGLKSVLQADYVMVHDAARCLVSATLIQRCVSDMKAFGSAVPALPLSDSIRKKENNKSVAVPRSNLYAVQTPQCFPTATLKKAFEQPYEEAFTDEATMMDSLGITVHLTEGERSNIKLTTPEDFLIAAALLKQ